MEKGTKCVRVSERMMDKIWKLHNNGFSPKEITDILDASKTTVNRVITIFTATEKQDVNLLGSYGGSSERIHEYASHVFGVSPDWYVKEHPAEEPTQDAVCSFDNTATYLIKLLNEISETNNMLKRICDALDV